MLWAHEGRPRREEDVSGDRCVVASYGQTTFVAVIDGLGHGEDASAAAERIASCVEGRLPAECLADLVTACHDAARRSRGACLTLAAIDERDMALEWISVGNVAAVLLPADNRPRRRPLAVGGVVGHRLPPLRPRRENLRVDDTIVIATDGLGIEFDTTMPEGAAPDAYARRLLEEFAHDDDDATVWVGHVEGGEQ